jgi:hypothetical protein
VCHCCICAASSEMVIHPFSVWGVISFPEYEKPPRRNHGLIDHVKFLHGIIVYGGPKKIRVMGFSLGFFIIFLLGDRKSDWKIVGKMIFRCPFSHHFLIFPSLSHHFPVIFPSTSPMATTAPRWENDADTFWGATKGRGQNHLGRNLADRSGLKRPQDFQWQYIHIPNDCILYVLYIYSIYIYIIYIYIYSYIHTLYIYIHIREALLQGVCLAPSLMGDTMDIILTYRQYI